LDLAFDLGLENGSIVGLLNQIKKAPSLEIFYISLREVPPGIIGDAKALDESLKSLKQLKEFSLEIYFSKLIMQSHCSKLSKVTNVILDQLSSELKALSIMMVVQSRIRPQEEEPELLNSIARFESLESLTLRYPLILVTTNTKFSLEHFKSLKSLNISGT